MKWSVTSACIVSDYEGLMHDTSLLSEMVFMYLMHMNSIVFVLNRYGVCS